MQFINVCTKKEYEKNGEKKTVWLNCGTVRVTAEGHRFMELNMFPNTTFYLFDQKKKEESPEFSG